MKKEIILFLIGILACNPTKKSELPQKLPADFVEFYDKFHSDSMFQIAHCIFPMSGLPDQMDSSSQINFKWTQDKWRMHKHIELGHEYTQNFEIITPKLITERILNAQQQIGMERHYAMMDGQWNLIYYVGMNQYKKPN